MKKSFTIIAFLLALYTLSAQDTIMWGCRDYMYYQSLPDLVFNVRDCGNLIGGGGANGTYYHGTGRNIPIYGIGVMLPCTGVTRGGSSYYNVYDSEQDSTERQVVICRLFNRVDTVNLYGTPVHVSNAEVIDTLKYANLCRKRIVTVPFQYNVALEPFIDTLYYVMYDYRLDSPLMLNNDTLALYSMNNRTNRIFPQINIYGYGKDPYDNLCGIGKIEGTSYTDYLDTSLSPYYCVYTNTAGLRDGKYLSVISCVFPILRPLPDSCNIADTTGTGGDDTVGISAVTGQAAIDIVPNPTDNVTTVSSAAPLRMVEAYDVAGRLLLRQPATGRTAKIDMSGYLPGCYILKIHTASGTAHRKLILR